MVTVTPVSFHPSRRYEVLCALVSGIVLRRFQVLPCSRRFYDSRVNFDQALIVCSASCLGEQILNRPFGLLVVTLAKVVIANASSRIDEIQRRPILIIERAPYGVVVVDSDWVLDSHLAHRAAHVLD